MKRSSLVPFLCLLLISPETYSVSVINSPGEKWYEQYSEIKPNENSRVKHAHEIFQRVLKSAVSKPRGVEPFLRVIDKPTLEVFAIQGGGVILAAGALNKCYENTQYGDDRLAFILGHEIAHQVKDDFWHERFFHAVGRVRIGAVDNTEEQDALDRTVIIAKQTDHIMTKELKADGQGIIYSSLAGYNPRAIIDEDNKVNFFLEWVEALNPTRIGAPPSKTHPDPKDRATFVKVQLKNILKKVDTYELGVMFYIAGDFANALSAFSKFIDIYPSPEVYSNLAASHHQLALNNLQLIEGDSDKMLFQLSISLDPNLRFIERWRGEDPKAAFQYHLDNAIKNYSYATSMDNRYLPALINLASAQILNDDADGAVSMLNNYL